MDKVYTNAKQNIDIRTYQRLEKLRKIGDKPVIVWGCGDLCLHMLTKVNLNIAYFADNDPAFYRATIGGISVMDTVHSDEPIVIIAQNQATGILKKIRDLGLSNEVILV